MLFCNVSYICTQHTSLNHASHTTHSVSSVPVAVQTNLIPPKKVQPGMLQSSLVQASVATMQNPMGCSLPRLSVSARPPSMVASMEAVAEGSVPFAMMKLKTVLAVFVVVVAYLVAGGLVFRALEQPFENNQKITITAEKAAFLQKHPCVTPDELEALIKVRAAIGRCSSLSSSSHVLPTGDSEIRKPERRIDLMPFKIHTLPGVPELDQPHRTVSHT